jgi:hypothetical protein
LALKKILILILITCVIPNFFKKKTYLIVSKKSNTWSTLVQTSVGKFFIGPCPHRDRDYPIGSNFWKFLPYENQFHIR